VLGAQRACAQVGETPGGARHIAAPLPDIQEPSRRRANLLHGYRMAEQRAELERFSDQLSGGAVVEALSPFERLVRWEVSDRAGSSHTIALRSGMTLSISRVRWERRWSLAFAPDPSTLKLFVTRGPGPRVTPAGGRAHDLAGGTAHVSRILRPVELCFDFEDATSGRAHEELCLEVGRERLCELMGTVQLPPPLERVWSSAESYPVEGLAAPAASFRVLDEIVHCTARGAARQLHLEAKGLELLGAWVDQLDNAREPLAGQLRVLDIERLERARGILLARLTAPPRLPELARLAGLDEAKLKAGFRAHFGDTVFGYLRRCRLEEAHRLLRGGRYDVSEVALRVGYQNPSKFAAAFKARFGVSPSHVR
jgi:AraC-like DNA-binding protein